MERNDIDKEQEMAHEGDRQGLEDMGISVSIDSDVQTRKGVFADFALIRTNGTSTVLDFILNDMPVSETESRGVLTARVFMSNSTVLDLRDMLVAHTAGWTRAGGPDER